MIIGFALILISNSQITPTSEYIYPTLSECQTELETFKKANSNAILECAEVSR